MANVGRIPAFRAAGVTKSIDRDMPRQFWRIAKIACKSKGNRLTNKAFFVCFYV